MAIRGRKPTATVIKLQTGTFRTDRHDQTEPKPEGAPEKPPKLRGRTSQLWDQFIVRAFWLTWADGPKAMMWCHLQAEFERAPGKMVSSRIAQLRALGSELGLDPASRARLGAKDDGGKKEDEPAKKYF